MASLKKGGETLAYWIDGKPGRPWLTLSHSIAGSSAMWDGLVRDLADEYQILRTDTRGHGASLTSGGSFSFAELASDVVAIWDELGIEKSHFAGLSLGGMIGQQLGFDHGDRLDRLVLCDCRPDAGEAFLAMWDGRIDAVKAGGMASIVDSTLERWFTQGFRTGEPELMAEIAGIIAATRVEGYLGCVAAVQGLTNSPRLGSITAPTLLLVGDEDGEHPELMRAMANLIPDSTYVEIPDAAHVPNIEQPAAFRAALLDFLR